jgi:SAM-dependent methyltransferase
MAFEELKESQGQMWGAGPFEEIEVHIADMHDALVGALQPEPGNSWLDLACGTGAVAMRAAAAGAEVTGVDLAPDLVETARSRAGEAGLPIEYETGDCEDLRFHDGTFDVVSSSVGIMFAPDQKAAAAEIARVGAPGGRLGLTAWRPDGGVGDFFMFMRQFQPPPPEGVGNPLDWGREEHVNELLGDSFELEFEELDTPFETESGEKFWDLFSRAFGPTKVLAESMDDAEREKFREATIEFAEREREGDVIRQSRTYLLTTGRRR